MRNLCESGKAAVKLLCFFYELILDQEQEWMATSIDKKKLKSLILQEHMITIAKASLQCMKNMLKQLNEENCNGPINHIIQVSNPDDK